MRAAVAGMALTALAACADVGFELPAFGALGGTSDATAEGIRTLSMLEGSVRVRGPEGYCVDQGASRAADGFAVMVGCALISPDASIMPSLDGLIVVQFGAPGSAAVAGSEDALRELLEAAPGRSLLSRTGDAGTVELAVVNTQINRVMARFADASGTGFAETETAIWRGFMDVGDRLTTVSVLSFERAPLTRERGKNLLDMAMSEVLSANTAPAPPALSAESGG